MFWKFSLRKIKKRRALFLAAVVPSTAFVALALLAVTGPFAPAPFQQWGVTFSKLQAERLGLNWQEAYRALLEDLGAARFRIPVYWPDIEPTQGQFDFSAYDWMLNEAEAHDASVILVIGKRLPRWPECHVPGWAADLSSDAQEEAVRLMLRRAVDHFKNRVAVSAWQVENEPFVQFFGECQKTSEQFLAQEVSLVKFLDSTRPIVMTDSGELGDWVRAARHADVFGTTMYRRVTRQVIFMRYFTYPLPPQFYRWKANVIHRFAPIRKLIVAELQGEPWVTGTPTASDVPLEEQYKTMSPAFFRETIEYAKRAGIGEIYWWGGEWWYWLKQNGHEEIWNTARELFDETL